jgi:glycosyltransferase involved in cell wall biosynthesis
MLLNNPKRIAFVINGLPVGGAEKFLISIVNHFFSIGYEPIVILLNDQIALLHELNPNIQIQTIKKKYRFDLFVSFRIRYFIKSHNINKVFCINAYPFFMTKLAFIFDRQTKFYLSLHSTIPNSTNIFIKNFFCYRLVSKRDVIVYLCKNQQQYLQKKYFIPNSFVSVINNGIDKDYFNINSIPEFNYDTLRATYNIPKGATVIINVARVSREKGHSCAIDALYILHKEFNSKSHLVFVGDGNANYLALLKQQVYEKSLQHYVHFTNVQSDVRKFYCISDLFTLTSTSETFSLAALEAMAFGLPISLTDVGGAREMLIEGVTGELANVNDAYSIAKSWNKLLGSNTKRNHIRQYFLDNFTSDRMYLDYEKLILSNQGV